MGGSLRVHQKPDPKCKVKWARRTILGPPNHVLHLVWSAYVYSKTIKIALKVELLRFFFTLDAPPWLGIPTWSPVRESVRIFSIGFHEYKMFTNRIMIIKQDNDHVDDQWWWSMGWRRLVDLVATQRKHYNEYKNKYSLQYRNDKQIKYKSLLRQKHRRYMIRVTCYISGALFLLNCMDGGFCADRLCLWETFIEATLGRGLILSQVQSRQNWLWSLFSDPGLTKFILGFDPQRWTQSTKDDI